jgi:prepilin-type N-terminal cleavage/methylation domain-containing protein
VAIRPPKYTSQGFTLIELLVTMMVAGIIIGFSAPSLLSLNKPLRSGVLQFKSHLNLIRSKAISSNKAYRLRTKYPTAAEYKGETYQNTPHQFIVEYAPNCRVNTYGPGLAKDAGSATPERPYNPAFPDGMPDGWMSASQLDLDLPDAVGIASSPLPIITTNGNPVTAAAGNRIFKRANQTGTDVNTAYEAPLNWDICYDNRGIADRAVSLTLQDSQGNNKAKSALIVISGVGGIDITTQDKNGANLLANGDNPDF